MKKPVSQNSRSEATSKRTVTARVMRSANRALILEFIRQNSPVARSVIARKLHMSLPTVMRIVDDLIAEDFVRWQDVNEPSGGRPRPLLEFRGSAYSVIGIDLGGTKMFGAVADLAGHLQHEVYMPHNGEGPEELLERLCQLIQQLLDAPRPAGQRIRGIGVGVPAVTLHPEGRIVWAPGLGWRDLPLRDILAQRFNLPVFVENDVNLAALGEWGFGAGKGARSLVCIAVGTGIGAGIVIDGTLLRGHHQAAGEIGYLLPGTQYLGRRYNGFGALESLASGLGIAERARQLLAQSGRPLPDDLSAETVFAAARQGATWAMQVVSETVDYLSLAIANICAVLDPEVVVLGGGVARSSDLLIKPILERLDGVLPMLPRVVASELDRRATVMGGIMLVLDATTEHYVVRAVS
jgi:glucokinase-like ROK family protein